MSHYPLPHITLRQLSVFLNIADTGSVTRAAHQIHRSETRSETTAARIVTSAQPPVLHVLQFQQLKPVRVMDTHTQWDVGYHPKRRDARNAAERILHVLRPPVGPMSPALPARILSMFLPRTNANRSAVNLWWTHRSCTLDPISLWIIHLWDLWLLRLHIRRVVGWRSCHSFPPQKKTRFLESGLSSSVAQPARP